MEQRFSKQRPRHRLAAVPTVLLLVLFAGAAAAADRIPLANGLTVRIHTAADLAADLTIRNGARLLSFPGLGELELLLGADDPRLPRADVQGFEPLPADQVLDALAHVDLPGAPLDVEVLLLPAPPVGTLGSFSTRNLIVLSPAFGPVAPETVHWLTVHELGHVLTWACFDRDADAWDAYRALRGLDPELHGADAPHNAREREILAEDLRFLFGGPLANSSGGIENPALATPDRVNGLAEFLRGVLAAGPVVARVPAASAWPNPCNPRTTVELRLAEPQTAPAAASARLEILDARGRRVRLIRGGAVINGSLQMDWDGTRDDGRDAATGRYFYRIGWQGLQGGGALTLLR